MGGAILLLIAVVLENRVADGNALIADVGARVIRGGGDQFTNDILTFMTKRTAKGIIGAGTLHKVSCTKDLDLRTLSVYRTSGSGMPGPADFRTINTMSLIHISEPTRLLS